MLDGDEDENGGDELRVKATRIIKEFFSGPAKRPDEQRVFLIELSDGTHVQVVGEDYVKPKLSQEGNVFYQSVINAWRVKHAKPDRPSLLVHQP